jgi:hypothetical protein
MFTDDAQKQPNRRIRTAKITHNILPRVYEQLKELALAQGRSRTRVGNCSY